MSVIDRLTTSLLPQVSLSPKQPKKTLPVPLLLPLPLYSPVIKKKPIQIPSFDDQGLLFEKHNPEQLAYDR